MLGDEDYENDHQLKPEGYSLNVLNTTFLIEPTFKDPVLPVKHCTLRSLGFHFCDVENWEAFVYGQNRSL